MNDLSKHGESRQPFVSLDKVTEAFKELEVRFNVDPDDHLCFLSQEVRELLLARKETPTESSKRAEHYTKKGVVLLADLAGYTHAVKELNAAVEQAQLETSQGRRRHGLGHRTDYLFKFISPFMGSLSEICHRWGGEVSQYAGDMLICIWKVDDGHNPPTSIERAESLAIQAAKEMVEVTKEIATSYELGDKVGLHGGIAAGDLVYIDLPYTNHGAQGGKSTDSETTQTQKRWCLVTGKPFRQAAENMNKCNSSGFEFQVSGNEEKLDPPKQKGNSVDMSKLDKMSVDAYVPNSVIEFFKHHKPGETGMIEDATLMFVSVPQCTEEGQSRIPEGNLAGFRILFEKIMSEITLNGGDLVNFLYDDKGCTLIARFTTRLPLRAALTIAQTELTGQKPAKGADLPKKCKVSLASGECYYGCIGQESGRLFFNVLSYIAIEAARYLGQIEAGQVACNARFINELDRRMSDQRVIPNNKQLSRQGSQVTRLPPGPMKESPKKGNMIVELQAWTTIIPGFYFGVEEKDIEAIEKV